jgi:radical SAM superfamily enzyme YgiQ (UPF0313 family)
VLTWLVVPPRPPNQTLNLLPPLGLGYLATACRPAGHRTEIVNCPLENLSSAQLIERIQIGKPDVVGLTVFSSDLATAADLCRRIKSLRQPPLILLGGIHPSSAPEQTLADIPEADFLFAGEAELGLPTLLGLLERTASPTAEALARIPGLGWRDAGAFHVNEKAFPADLDALGFPSWDLLQPLRYQDYPPTLFVRQRPFAPIITSRGCPHRCTYCGGHNVSGYRPRQRSVEHVLQEIAVLHQQYGIRELHIEDDNFTMNRSWVVEFCERLLATGWDLSWTMPNGVRLDTLDLELLKLMKRAGCYFLIVGVESGSDRILKQMRKQLTIRQVEEKIRLIHEAGILAHAFLMVGFPGEEPADFRATLDLSLRLPLIGAHFASFRPLPGTECADALLAAGEIRALPHAAESSTFASVVYAPRGMSVDQVKAWQRRMLLAFYLRPRILWFYLRGLVRHPGNALNLLRRARLYLLSR